MTELGGERPVRETAELTFRAAVQQVRSSIQEWTENSELLMIEDVCQWLEDLDAAFALAEAGRAERPHWQPVSVAGPFARTYADFERSCLVHIDEEQRRANPDNALIALLCDAVRLTREVAPPLVSGEADPQGEK